MLWLVVLGWLVPGAVRAQEGVLVLRSTGAEYGFQDEDDPTRLVSVRLGGVEVVLGSRRMAGRSLVIVWRRGGESDPGPQGDAAGEGLILSADRILEVFLDGDVTLEEGDEVVLGAQSLHLDNTTGEMTILEGEWRGSFRESPLVVRYDALRQLGDGTREMEGVSYTTCEYAHAHWSLETPWARLVPTLEGKVLHTAGNTVEIGGLPLLWLPGLHVNTERDRPPIRRIEFGTSNRFGTAIATLWGGDASAGLAAVLDRKEREVDAEWQLELSNFSSRGVFVEPTLEYRVGTSSGKVFGSYIHDRNEADELGAPIEDDTRGRFDLEHRTRIDARRTLDVELSYISDAGYLEEYYENEFRTGKEQETYINFRDVEDNEAMQILTRMRLNDFDTQVEYLPEIERRTVGEMVDTGPFGQAAFTSRSFISNGQLKREDDPLPSDPSAIAPREDRALRVGTTGQLDWPIDVGDDRLRINAGYSLTGFDKHADEPDDPETPGTFERVDDDGSVLRYALTGGVEWARTYSGVGEARSETWNFDGVRQILEPRTGYASVLELNEEPDDLITIDETESLRKLHTFFVGVRHRVQTHQRGGVATVLDTDVNMLVFPNEERDNPTGDERTAGPISIDTTWRPGARLWGLRAATLRWRARIDPNDWAYNRSFTSYTTTIGPDRRFVVTHDKVQHVSNFLTVGLEWVLTPKWSAAVFEQQDLLLHESSRRGIILRQRAHRWIFDVELSQRRGDNFAGSVDDADELQVSLKLRPAFLDEDDDESLLQSLVRIRRT